MCACTKIIPKCFQRIVSNEKTKIDRLMFTMKVYMKCTSRACEVCGTVNFKEKQNTNLLANFTVFLDRLPLMKLLPSCFLTQFTCF